MLEARRIYVTLWWSGLLGGCLAAALGGVLLRRAAKRLGAAGT